MTSSPVVGDSVCLPPCFECLPHASSGAAPCTQTKYLLVEAPTHAPITPRVALGVLVWAAGWLINLQADHILINLRKPGETGGQP